jgi:formate hydrogenlyase subunit 3/multisubunit Na+/H+ antiporter MnhD subunit
MVGLIWFVQRVHYPLLAQVDVGQQISVGAEHQRRTAQVVGLPMAVEGVSTLILLVYRPDQVVWWLPWMGAILLAISLGSTVFLSVPLHQKMVNQPSAELGKKLVSTNWPRTISWTLRGVICVVMCAQAAR